MSTDPGRQIPKSCGNPSQKSGGYCNSNQGLTLEWDDQQAHMDLMVRCLQTLGHSEVFTLVALLSIQSLFQSGYNIKPLLASC